MRIRNNFIFPLDENLLILTFFSVLSIIGICYHEIWLDEAQHFLLARDSKNIHELIYASRNEGHPLLWNFLLFIITRFSNNLFYMQLAGVCISCFTVMIICKSNLSFLEKILIVFGYYFLYEYNVISRNYGLSTLMIFLLVYNYLTKRDELILLSIIICLLANTHLFSLLFSFAFVFTYIIHNRDIFKNKSIKVIIASASILFGGWIISVYSIIPPVDYGINFINYDSSPYFSSERILKTLSVCLKGIFYIPDYSAAGHHFENSLYYVTLNLKTWVIFILSGFAIIIPAYIIKNNGFAFTLFISFLIIFIPVYYFLPLVTGIRYFGFFYVVFVASYWIAKPQISVIGIRISAFIFALQFINGVLMYSFDLKYPFSESKNISDYLKVVKMQNENVIILERVLRPAISAYSGKVYFGMENGQLLSYSLWQTCLPDSLLKAKLNTELKKNTTSLIVSSNKIYELIDTAKAIRLKSFCNGIIRGENATVYRYYR